MAKGKRTFPAEQPAPCTRARIPACVCARALAARSCRAAAARAVARSLRDPAEHRQGLATVLPARYRMTRSTDFGQTVNKGVRAVQPDLVVHALRAPDDGSDVPKIGLVVSKSVGNAVQRHRVSRMLRHVARGVARRAGRRRQGRHPGAARVVGTRSPRGSSKSCARRCAGPRAAPGRRDEWPRVRGRSCAASSYSSSCTER